jgi:hypothetical protein
VGLHSDPLVLHAVNIFCSLGPYMEMLDPGRRGVLQRDICQLILCAGDLRAGLAEPGAADALLARVFDTPPRRAATALASRRRAIARARRHLRAVPEDARRPPATGPHRRYGRAAEALRGSGILGDE